MPFVGVFCPHDEIVPWQGSLDPAARHLRINATHRGLITSPALLQFLAHELTTLTPTIRRRRRAMSAQEDRHYRSGFADELGGR